METNNNFVRQSLELNLFFLRVFKEHSLFIALGFIPENKAYIQEALNYQNEYNNLLAKAIDLSSGLIKISNDMVTDFTLDCEQKVSKITNIPIASDLTKKELSMRSQNLNRVYVNDLFNDVKRFNDLIIKTTKNLIRFKTRILDDILACRIQFNNYATFIEHDINEAVFYVDKLIKLQNNNLDYNKEIIENEMFWNHIMKEHSEFIRGLLDPSEKTLMEIANEFVKNYEKLNTLVFNALNKPKLVKEVTKDSLSLTEDIHNFKTDATKGLLNCEIKSIINPLLADHVLRESNHYIKLLENYNKNKS